MGKGLGGCKDKQGKQRASIPIQAVEAVPQDAAVALAEPAEPQAKQLSNHSWVDDPERAGDRVCERCGERWVAGEAEPATVCQPKEHEQAEQDQLTQDLQQAAAQAGEDDTQPEHDKTEVEVKDDEVLVGGLPLSYLMKKAQVITDNKGMTTLKLPKELMKNFSKEDFKLITKELKKLKEKEAKRQKAERDKLIAETLKEHGEAALHHIQPLALKADLVSGDPEDPDIMLEKCVEVQITASPLFDAALQKLGAVRRGKRTWSFQAVKDAPVDNLIGLLKALPTQSLYTKERWDKLGYAKKGYKETWNNEAVLVRAEVSLTQLGQQLGFGNTMQALLTDSGHYPPEGFNHAAVVMQRSGNELTFKLYTQKDHSTKTLELYPGAPNLHQLREGEIGDPVRVTPDVAFSLIGEARRRRMFTIVDPKLEELRDKKFQRVVLARPVPGSPGEAELVVGDQITLQDLDYDLTPLPGEIGARSVRLPAYEAGEIVKAAGKNPEALNMLSREVEDVIRMEHCEVEEIDGLLPHQNKAVALHLATEIGYLNASDMGAGKTPMSLAGMEKKWERIEKSDTPRPYRALVGAKASLCQQWIEESAKFFPAAEIFHLKGKANVPKLAAKLKEHDDAKPPKPLVVVGSYQAIAAALPVVSQWEWDDLILDEAAFLKGKSNIRDAFWELRDKAKCAVALTGTPIDKGLDDIGQIISWVRNDPSLFTNRKLSERFDMSREEDLKRFWHAVGPVIYRVDSSVIADQLPKLKVELLEMTPHPAEKNLADGARKELKNILVDLQEALEKQVQLAEQKGDVDPELLQAAKEELQNIRGAVLAGTVLARQAASDPAAVQESESIAAALLEEKGLIEPAVEHGGTKRRELVKRVSEKVERGEQVLIFTDFVPVAERLKEELAEQGVRVEAFTGKQSDKQRNQAKQRFQGTPCEKHRRRPGAVSDCPDCKQPEVDVMVLTQVANEGLNLQKAKCMIHADLSWVPSRFLQRVGRARRLGSEHKELDVEIALMKDTIEEHVAAVLVPRAMKALMALDGARGADLSHSALTGMSKKLAKVLGEEYTKDEASIFELAKKMVLKDD